MMTLVDDDISRQLDFIVEFKQALIEALGNSDDLEEAVRLLEENGYKGEQVRAGQIVFNYAMDSLMKLAIPIFLRRLCKENNPDFIQDLAEALTVNWSEAFSRGSDRLVN